MKTPIRLTGVRLSYPSIRRPADSTDLMQHRGPSFTIRVPSQWGPLAQAYLWSVVMGGRMPPISAFVRHDPQKLLPPPGPGNRPMSSWDGDEFLRQIGSMFGASYAEMSAKYYDGGTVIPRWGEADASPFEYVERFRRAFAEPWAHKVVVVKVDNPDFGLIEARVLASMVDSRVKFIHLDIESAYGEISGNPQLDIFLAKPLAEKTDKKAPPAYLKHDPTKRHKRR